MNLRKLFFWEVSNKMQLEVVMHAHLRIESVTIWWHCSTYFIFSMVTLCLITECPASLKHPKVIEQVMEQGVGWVAFVAVSY